MYKKIVVLALVQATGAFDPITTCEKGTHGDAICVNDLDDDNSCCMYYKAIEDDPNASGFQRNMINGLDQQGYPTKKGDEAYLCLKEKIWKEVVAESDEKHQFNPVIGSKLKYETYCAGSTTLVASFGLAVLSAIEFFN